MMKKLLLILIPLMLVLSACTNPHEARIQQIDNLLFALDSTKFILHDIDSGAVLRRNNSCAINIKKINDLTDTVDREAVFLIDEYAGYQKAYRKSIQKLFPFYEEIEIIPAQLKNLKKDLSKNLLSEKDAEVFLENESRAALKLTEIIIEMSVGLKTIDERFIVCEEKILLLIERLEAINQEELES